MSERKPFDIPGINNQFEVLCVYLGIDTDNETQVATIDQRFTAGAIHHYVHKNIEYYVASSSQRLFGDRVHSFNSNLWSILKVDDKAPYRRFKDGKVKAKLETLIQGDCEVIELDQVNHTAIVKIPNKPVYQLKYSSLIPEDIESYYLKGRI